MFDLNLIFIKWIYFILDYFEDFSNIFKCLDIFF